MSTDDPPDDRHTLRAQVDAAPLEPASEPPAAPPSEPAPQRTLRAKLRDIALALDDVRECVPCDHDDLRDAVDVLALRVSEANTPPAAPPSEPARYEDEPDACYICGDTESHPLICFDDEFWCADCYDKEALRDDLRASAGELAELAAEWSAVDGDGIEDDSAPPAAPPSEPARRHHLEWSGTEWVDDRCGCRYHPDDDNGKHGGAPHVHRCERHERAAALRAATGEG